MSCLHGEVTKWSSGAMYTSQCFSRQHLSYAEKKAQGFKKNKLVLKKKVTVFIILASDCTREVRYSGLWFVGKDEMPHTLADTHSTQPCRICQHCTWDWRSKISEHTDPWHDRDTPTNKTSHFQLLSPQAYYYLAAPLVSPVRKPFYGQEATQPQGTDR